MRTGRRRKEKLPSFTKAEAEAEAEVEGAVNRKAPTCTARTPSTHVLEGKNSNRVRVCDASFLHFHSRQRALSALRSSGARGGQLNDLAWSGKE